jgi:hypothetical protein
MRGTGSARTVGPVPRRQRESFPGKPGESACRGSDGGTASRLLQLARTSSRQAVAPAGQPSDERTPHPRLPARRRWPGQDAVVDDRDRDPLQAGRGSFRLPITSANPFAVMSRPDAANAARTVAVWPRLLPLARPGSQSRTTRSGQMRMSPRWLSSGQKPADATDGAVGRINAVRYPLCSCEPI